jgi:polysaccharide export outer membrane protein
MALLHTSHPRPRRYLTPWLTILALVAVPVFASAQTPPAAQPSNAVQLPADYVIGPDDVLNVVFWTAKEMSHEVLVRPDGRISLPLINDVPAAGLTPLQLSENIRALAMKFVLDAGNTVIVTAINSRRVYVVGEVSSPGPFPLASAMTVLQAIGQAGGFVEGANKGNVVIVRMENGQERRFRFNYDDVLRGRNLQQNIRLMPGDTILVR